MTALAQSPAGSSGKRKPRYAREKPEVRRRLLIEAAIRCLGAGGLSAFTIDRICREAKVSRGLINHYFGSKDALLVRVYETMTVHLAESAPDLPAGASGSPFDRLKAQIEASFDPAAFDRSQLKAWLALWGELPTNRALQALHRKRYGAYRSSLAEAIAAVAKAGGRAVDAEGLALKLIALIDGLWLEWCLDPKVLSADAAKAACYGLLEAELGPIER